MPRICFFFILALAMVFIGEINAQQGVSERRCPQNEEYNDCGTACPLTCKNPRPRGCTRQCVPGCFCRPGWFRNNRRVCVRQC